MGETTLRVTEETRDRFKQLKPYESLSADEFLNELCDKYNRELEAEIRGAVEAWESSAMSMAQKDNLDEVGRQFASDYWTVAQELRHILGQTDEPIVIEFQEMQTQLKAIQDQVVGDDV